MRCATKEDYPALILMAERFCAAACVEFDRDSCLATLDQILSSDMCVAFIDDGAMLIGMAYPCYFNRTKILAQELCWWVDESRRGSTVGVRMLDSFERWAEEKGASEIHMIALAAIDPDRVANIYKRRGYEAMEYTFSRKTKWQ